MSFQGDDATKENIIYYGFIDTEQLREGLTAREWRTLGARPVVFLMYHDYFTGKEAYKLEQKGRSPEGAARSLADQWKKKWPGKNVTVYPLGSGEPVFKATSKYMQMVKNHAEYLQMVKRTAQAPAPQEKPRNPFSRWFKR